MTGDAPELVATPETIGFEYDDSLTPRENVDRALTLLADHADGVTTEQAVDFVWRYVGHGMGTKIARRAIDEGPELSDAFGPATNAAAFMGGDTEYAASPEEHRKAMHGGPEATGTPYVPQAMSVLPLAQLDALGPEERRREAKKRGLGWPTTDEARDRLEETIQQAIRHEDTAVVDAPTSLGKTHTVAATRWGAREDITNGRPVVHLLPTRDARDEAAATAAADGGDHFVLRARHEACPVAAGDHDPADDEDADDPEPVVTIRGEAASKWLRRMCDGRGIPFSAAHRYLERHNDQGLDALPCCADDDEECWAIEQWDVLRDEDHPLVVATHNFAHVPGLRMGTNLVFDERPDFAQDLDTADVRRAVGAYLRAVDAPVGTWEQFIQLARHDAYDTDAADERDALQAALNRDPDREWYFETPDAHTLAPALARAIFHAEPRANGRRVGKTPYEPPRLDAWAHDDEDGWNRSWVTVVLDDNNDIATVRMTPDLSLARSVLGLDAHPALPVWRVNTHPDMQRKQVLDRGERRRWRRYERGLRVVQVSDATRPLASGEYFDHKGARALAGHLRERYGTDFRTAITTKSVEDRLAALMDKAGVSDPELMHFGEEKSRNDFAAERVGLVEGCIDPGDDYVLDLLAERDLDAEPERADVECDHCEGDGCHECAGTGFKRAHGRGFTGPDADTAAAILAAVRENHTAQAAGRYARDPDDPESHATVYVRTDAMPPGFADLQVPGIEWAFAEKQEQVLDVLRAADRPLPAREIADRAGCSKKHVRETLERLADDSHGGPTVQAFKGEGAHGATLYADAGVPNAGVVDLGDEIATSPVWGPYTWSVAIRDPSSSDAGCSDGVAPSPPADAGEWAWEAAANGGDPPPDDPG